MQPYFLSSNPLTLWVRGDSITPLEENAMRRVSGPADHRMPFGGANAKRIPVELLSVVTGKLAGIRRPSFRWYLKEDSLVVWSPQQPYKLP